MPQKIKHVHITLYEKDTKMIKVLLEFCDIAIWVLCFSDEARKPIAEIGDKVSLLFNEQR